jgi:hypothetical protein
VTEAAVTGAAAALALAAAGAAGGSCREQPAMSNTVATTANIVVVMGAPSWTGEVGG